jgi:hypothetical protein
MPAPSRIVGKIHFEDFGGAEFERLVFAYHVRAGWADLAWYGQTGSDQGRDIVGVEPLVDRGSRRTIIQCVNQDTITQKKAVHDMLAAITTGSPPPEAFKFVARCAISSVRRDAINASATRIGFAHTTIWSGVEFEEHLRLCGEDLLRRFCAGEPFPDSGDDIRRFAEDFVGLDDEDALSLMAAVLDRPAFRTRFDQECSLPAFLQAIEDTMAAINTGVWRTREGVEVRRVPSMHHLRNARARAAVARTAALLDELRRTFVSFLRAGKIKHCSCGDKNCPVFYMAPGIATQLDQLRMRALDSFRQAYPAFSVRLA